MNLRKRHYIFSLCYFSCYKSLRKPQINIITSQNQTITKSLSPSRHSGNTDRVPHLVRAGPEGPLFVLHPEAAPGPDHRVLQLYRKC